METVEDRSIDCRDCRRSGQPRGFEYLRSMMLRDWQFRRNMMVTGIR